MIGKVKEKVKNFPHDWIGGLRNKPVKLVFAVLVMVSMLILTFLAWDGMPKRLVICIGLSILSGILLSLPRLSNWVSVPMLAVYLCYVPKKVFERMELPVHDMSGLVDGAELLTVAFIICAYLVVFLFTQSTAAALGGVLDFS